MPDLGRSHGSFDQLGLLGITRVSGRHMSGPSSRNHIDDEAGPDLVNASDCSVAFNLVTNNALPRSRSWKGATWADKSYLCPLPRSNPKFQLNGGQHQLRGLYDSSTSI